MPDADDFDVEYFRNLLKGNSSKAADAAPPPPAPKRRKPQAGAPAAPAAKAKPVAGRKNNVKRPRGAAAGPSRGAKKGANQ